MTRRLVAAFLLGGLAFGAIVWHSQRDSVPYGVYEQCATDFDALVTICDERAMEIEMWGRRSYCRLREAEVLLRSIYPEWPGYYSERERERFDVEYNCAGPEMAPLGVAVEESR